jgi:hypothetical protein
MSWPTAGTRSLTTLRVDTAAIVLPVDEASGRPPSVPPPMRLFRNDVAGNRVELAWGYRHTLGGAVVFSGFDRISTAQARSDEDFLLLVDGDDVLRPDSPDGYQFTVPAAPLAWPVQVAVPLLPGPSYPHPRRVPVVHGRVLHGGGDSTPVSDAIVAAHLTAGICCLPDAPRMRRADSVLRSSG